MAQDATLATRPSKKDLSAGEAIERWEATATAQGHRLAELADNVTGRSRHRRAQWVSAATPRQLLERLADIPRATFSRHDLLRAALDVIDPAGHDAHELQRQAEQLVRATVVNPEVVQVSAPDIVDVPDGLRRSDGSSVYDRPGRGRWALTHTIDAEAWLLQTAGEAGSPSLAAQPVEAAAAGHGLDSVTTSVGRWSNCLATTVASASWSARRGPARPARCVQRSTRGGPPAARCLG